MAQAISAVRGNENLFRKKVIVALAFGPVSDTEKWPNVRMLQWRAVHTISDPGGKQMKYRAILCGGLLATAVLLSFPHASSALPAAPSALLPAAQSSDLLIVVRGGGGRGGGHARGGGGGAVHARTGGGGTVHARGGGGGTVRARTGGGTVTRSVHVNGHVGGGVVRPWVRRPYFGTIVGGVALGTLIAVTAAPVAPAPNLCWYWADPSQTQGYWDYCQ
jgi:hypothetical protein